MNSHQLSKPRIKNLDSVSLITKSVCKEEKMLTILFILSGIIVGGGIMFGWIPALLNLPALLATATAALTGWGALSVLQQLPEIIKVLFGG